MATGKVQVLERFGFARRVANIAQSVFDRNKQPEAQWATVVARDGDGRPTVAIDGGETVTCHSWAAEAFEDDRVTVAVRNHKACLLTNETRPATDDSTAIELDVETNGRIDDLEGTVDDIEALVGENKKAADVAAKAAHDAADAAQKDADAAARAAKLAQETADATKQHFFHDSDGVHVSTQADSATGAANALLNSTGLLFRAASTWLAQLTTSALAFYDGLGNAASNVVAQFTSTSQRIGRVTEGNIVVNPTSILFSNASTWLAQLSSSALTFYDGNGNTDANSTAQYSGDVARIGKLSKSHIVADGAGVTMYNQGNESMANFGSDITLGKTSTGNWNAKLGASAMDFRLGTISKMRMSQGDTGHGMVEFGVDGNGFRNIQGRVYSGLSMVHIMNQALGYDESLDFNIDSSGGYIEASVSRQRSGNSNVYDLVSSARLGAGGLMLNGHSSAIGTVKENGGTTAKSLDDGTWNCGIGTIALDEGVWLLIGKARFASNASGTRNVAFGEDASNPGTNTFSRVTQAACGNNRMQTVTVVSPTDATTYYLKAYQNSGSKLNVESWHIRAVRIA